MSDNDPSDQHGFRAAAGKMPPPNPARPPRHDEWTPAKMVAFLRELAASQSVSQAARAVGMGRQSAYKLKRRLPPFAAAWDEAVADSRLAVAPAPVGGPRRCPLCGGAPRRALRWEGA